MYVIVHGHDCECVLAIGTMVQSVFNHSDHTQPKTGGRSLFTEPHPYSSRLAVLLSSLSRVGVSRPQLKDDGGQYDEEGVPAQGDSKTSPHHHPSEAPA